LKDAVATVGGGRRNSFTDLGDPDGPCLFFFHGAPMSRLHLVGLDEQLSSRGIRVISPDRPSYGHSSPQPRRALTDWPADVSALADAHGIDRFVVAGHSSGGPYAIACAALLPERVSAALVLAGVTDMGWPGAWEGYLEVEALLMRLGAEEDVLAWCVEHFGADASRFEEAFPFHWPEPDRALLADPNAAASVGASVAEAFRQGVAGYAQDVFVQGRPWPFEPEAIRTPVEIVHGESDTVVPMAHSRHTARSIPGARLRTLPGHGHLTIVAELPALAAALVAPRRSPDQ
jgi:pimeloyl-ACP methyl ester carboxylesterase